MIGGYKNFESHTASLFSSEKLIPVQGYIELEEFIRSDTLHTKVGKSNNDIYRIIK